MTAVPALGIDSDLGAAWVRAIAEGDRTALVAVLDPAVEFRALTPGGSWEASTADETGDVVLGRWFAKPRHIESVERVVSGEVGGRQWVSYRFRATTPEGAAVVEQQAYFDIVGGRIAWLRILCSGFRLEPADHGS